MPDIWAGISAIVFFEFDIGGNPVTLLHFLGLLIVLPVGFMVGKRVGRFVGRQMSRAMTRRMPMITTGTTVGRAPLPTGMAVLSGLAGGVARWLTTAVVWLIGLEAVGLDMAIFKVMVGVLALGIPFATAAISRNGVAGMVVLLEGTLEGRLSGQAGKRPGRTPWRREPIPHTDSHWQRLDRLRAKRRPVGQRGRGGHDRQGASACQRPALCGVDQLAS